MTTEYEFTPTRFSTRRRLVLETDALVVTDGSGTRWIPYARVVEVLVSMRRHGRVLSVRVSESWGTIVSLSNVSAGEPPGSDSRDTQFVEFGVALGPVGERPSTPQVRVRSAPFGGEVTGSVRGHCARQGPLLGGKWRHVPGKS